MVDEVMVCVDFLFWVVGKCHWDFFILMVEVMIDVTSVRHCIYIEIFSNMYFFCENKYSRM